MPDKNLFKEIRERIEKTIEGYLKEVPDEEILKNLRLKAEHTFKVEENIERLAEAIGLDEAERDLARLIALLHDIGRFPQYLKYRTFRDAESVNHAVLSVEEIERLNLLDGLDDRETRIITSAVKFHNAYTLPETVGDQQEGLFIRLIRDADKLDIWRVFSEYFALPPHSRPSGAAFGLPDTEGFSHEIVDSIKSGRMASLKDVKNLNDFRLLQLSWVYDLNFRESFRIFRERGYLSQIAPTSPLRDDRLRDAIGQIEEYLQRRLDSKVYFIGAGPGDPELLTVKGRRLLESSDVVIYAGSLINPQILQGLKARLYDSSGMTLDEIINLMKRYYHEAKVVVRLHSGDLSIYSSLNEQIEVLKRLKIPFEIIPGLSSFQAGAAQLGQELTIPEISQTVILTRLEGRTPVPAKERLSELARHNATMVIFLSAGMVERVQEELLQAYPEDTPVAIVEKASWPDGRVFRGRLKELADICINAGIKRTALIYIGDVLKASLSGEDLTGRYSRLYSSDFEHSFRKGSR